MKDIAFVALLFPTLAVLFFFATPVLAQTQQYPSVVDCDIRATPQSIVAGDSAVLSWQIFNFNFFGFLSFSGSIDNGVGALTGNGSRAVYPSQTTTYTLTANYDIFFGLVSQPFKSCQTTVTVTPKADRCVPTYSCVGNAIRNSCNGVVSPCAAGAQCAEGQCVACGTPSTIPVDAGSCSASYTEPGTYTFTVPSAQQFNGLTVTVNGAGGGGGSGECDDYYGSQGWCRDAGPGISGGASSFGSFVAAQGGEGGAVGASIYLLSIFFPPAPGAAGSGSGGDANTTGGGAAGGLGGKAANLTAFGGGNGSRGGNGGKAVKDYGPGDLAPGSTIAVTVGQGGRGGGAQSSGSTITVLGGSTAGHPGSDGSVTIMCK